MVDIELLKRINRPEQIAITEHARIRLVERGITVNDIIECINSGEIIEQYEGDKPLPSCLILGMTENNSYVHIVVSCDGEWIYLITAYYPNSDIWEADCKTRRQS